MAGSRYEIIRQLACGGMAEVLLARQFTEVEGAKSSEKLVVIKRVLPHLCQEEVFLKMFAFEARIASQLKHPHIVSVLEVGSMDGMPFIALERLDGADLLRLMQQCTLRRQNLGVAVGLAVIAGAARGLGYAHRARSSDGRALKIVHRDVSPHNIFVTRDGGVKILDFGIAKSAAYVGHTSTGQVKGKVAYMSPEQIRGHKIDSRSDLWSLGVVLWEAISGEKLYARDNDAATLHAILNEPIPELHCPEAPGLNALVRSVLEHDIEKRIATAEEFATRIDRMLAAMSVAEAARVVALRVGSLVPALNPELDAVKPLVRRNPEVVTFAVGPAPLPQRRALELRPREEMAPASQKFKHAAIDEDDDEPTVAEFDDDLDLDDHPTIITFSDDPSDEIDDATTQRSYPELNDAVEVAESPTVQTPSVESIMANRAEAATNDSDFDFDDFQVPTVVVASPSATPPAIRSSKATMNGLIPAPSMAAPLATGTAMAASPSVAPPSVAPPSVAPRASNRPVAPVLPSSVFPSGAVVAARAAPPPPPLSLVPPLADASVGTMPLSDFAGVGLRPSISSEPSVSGVARVKPRGSRPNDQSALHAAANGTPSNDPPRGVKTSPQGSMGNLDDLKPLPFESMFAPAPEASKAERRASNGAVNAATPSPSSAFPNPFASAPAPPLGRRGPSAFATSEIRSRAPDTLAATELSVSEHASGSRARRVTQSLLLVIGATCFIAGLTIFTIRMLSLGDTNPAEASGQVTPPPPRTVSAAQRAPAAPPTSPLRAPAPQPTAPQRAAPMPVAPTPTVPIPAAPIPAAPIPAAPTPIAPTPIAPVAVAPAALTPVAPLPVAPAPQAVAPVPAAPVRVAPLPVALPTPPAAAPRPVVAAPQPVVVPAPRPAPVVAPAPRPVVAAPAPQPVRPPPVVRAPAAPVRPRPAAQTAPRHTSDPTHLQNRHVPQGSSPFDTTPAAPPSPRRPPPSAHGGGIFTDFK